ncbi:MAG: hypothetical protein ABII64_02950 [Elusimicrobiota bacterium]
MKKILIAVGIILSQCAFLYAQGKDDFLNIRLDNRGPYLILVTEPAGKEYSKAVLLAKKLHPEAILKTVSKDDITSVKELLHNVKPYYILWIMKPGELDANFQWQWLKLVCELDEDPFADARTGFITGESPKAAAKFMNNIINAVNGKQKLPAVIIDNFGPNTMVGKYDFNKFPVCSILPALSEKWPASSISHGTEGFDDSRLSSMDGAGIVHFGGHGHPDRIDDGLTGAQVRKLKLSPSVVFNGACYTGVTGTWFDIMTGKVKQKYMQAEKCFCLRILNSTVIGYLAALHPDHGIPVYQEMEYMAYTGESLGNVIKRSYDSVVLASGGKKPDFELLSEGMLSDRNPANIMMRGTASRVLFGDPALIVTDPITEPPFIIEFNNKTKSRIMLKAILKNARLMSSYTDTFYSDMSDTKQFNDRALIDFVLPIEWDSIGSLKVIDVTAGDKHPAFKLIGYSVEKDGENNILHVQVDLTSEGFMSSSFRSEGSEVELLILR